MLDAATLGNCDLGAGLPAPHPCWAVQSRGWRGWAEIPAPSVGGVGEPTRLSGGVFQKERTGCCVYPMDVRWEPEGRSPRGWRSGACARCGPGQGDGWAEIFPTATWQHFSPAFLIKYCGSQVCFKWALNNSHLLIATVIANLSVRVWLTLEPIPGVGS